MITVPRQRSAELWVNGAPPLDPACVLFDFDGPICGLFARHPAERVAQQIRQALHSADLLPTAVAEDPDPHHILREIRRLLCCDDRTAPCAAEAEAMVAGILEAEELRAAGTAPMTPLVGELIDLLSGRGVGLAVVSNNSAVAVEAFLEARGILGVFRGGIHGRPTDPSRIKPNPAGVLEAMGWLDAVPGRTVLVGDSPADYGAARAAGVGFVGFSAWPGAGEALRTCGATVILDSFAPLLR